MQLGEAEPIFEPGPSEAPSVTFLPQRSDRHVTLYGDAARRAWRELAQIIAVWDKAGIEQCPDKLLLPTPTPAASIITAIVDTHRHIENIATSVGGTSNTAQMEAYKRLDALCSILGGIALGTATNAPSEKPNV